MTRLTEAEKQLISSLSWFRTRYALFLGLDQDRQADRQNIEDFGQFWIGQFKQDWSKAFDSLVKKEFLSLSAGEYAFTQKGESVKTELEKETPFYKYEYDHFFHTESTSDVHSKFCEKVYGKDLSQHGLIDQEELSVLVESLKLQNCSHVLDIGCGNGRITEHLSDEVGVQFLGVDISTEAIDSALERTKKNEKISFRQENLDALDLSEKFDAILFLDTLYYADNLANTIQNSLNSLTKKGRIYAYFSQWIMDTNYAKNLEPDNTHLAKVLTDLGLEFSTVNLTKSGIRHWKKKLEVLEDMKQDFTREGNEGLWQYRYNEAYRYANWGDQKYARYFYEIRNAPH